jgi:hypothetical protein
VGNGGPAGECRAGRDVAEGSADEAREGEHQTDGQKLCTGTNGGGGQSGRKSSAPGRNHSYFIILYIHILNSSQIIRRFTFLIKFDHSFYFKIYIFYYD